MFIISWFAMYVVGRKSTESRSARCTYCNQKLRFVTIAVYGARILNAKPSTVAFNVDIVDC